MTTSPMQPGAQLCHVVHMGIEYNGEVVRALAWTDGLGAQLRGDTYFRVVFLESLPAALPPPQALEDSRIAVCILGYEPGSSATQVSVEMRAIRIAGCAATVTQENVQEFPRCRECGLRLTAQPPSKDVESLGSYIRQALGEQNRRLSTVLVERLLQGEQSEEMDRFIRVVQVSDLSGLAHVLNDELVQFIGDLLAIPGR